MYSLREMESSDIDRVLSDFSGADDAYKRLLWASKNKKEFPLSWSIDDGKGNYVFSAPIMVRPEGIDWEYYAFINGCVYKINSVGTAGTGAYFIGNSTNDPEIISEIIFAFSVFGRWGSGPLSKKGVPSQVFLPEFEGR